jgi:N6-adenosine-specific RNA methylase IME4
VVETLPFDVVVSDPPWKFGDKLPGAGRGAEKHYPCLTIEELRWFPLPPIAPDAWLFLWRVAAMPQQALDLVHAWGFVPKSEFVWNKTTSTGKPFFGMGRYTRAAHEVCIIATRGKPHRASASVRSTFDAPVGRHSEKPERFYELVEELTGPNARRVEMFARTVRPGWFGMGNELPRQKRARTA